jgi:hypothetical protein
MSGEPPAFETAAELARRQAGRPAPFRYAVPGEAAPPEAAPPASSLVVRPELSIQQSVEVWNAYLRFRDAILNDPQCFDVIEGSKEMNRTGATRLAVPFGLSIEEREFEEGGVQDAATNEWDYRFRVRVRVSKGARFVDGIGSCRLSEIPARSKDRGEPGTPDFRPGKEVPIGQREHFAMAKAWTRAAKRAIADILGGTEAD